MVHARIEPDFKRGVEELFALLGPGVTEAVTLFDTADDLIHDLGI